MDETVDLHNIEHPFFEEHEHMDGWSVERHRGMYLCLPDDTSDTRAWIVGDRDAVLFNRAWLSVEDAYEALKAGKTEGRPGVICSILG